MIKLTIHTLGGESEMEFDTKEEVEALMDEHRDAFIAEVNSMGLANPYLTVLRGEHTMSLFSSVGVRVYKYAEVNN